MREAGTGAVLPSPPPHAPCAVLVVNADAGAVVFVFVRVCVAVALAAVSVGNSALWRRAGVDQGVAAGVGGERGGWNIIIHY